MLILCRHEKFRRVLDLNDIDQQAGRLTGLEMEDEMEPGV